MNYYPIFHKYEIRSTVYDCHKVSMLHKNKACYYPFHMTNIHLSSPLHFWIPRHPWIYCPHILLVDHCIGQRLPQSMQLQSKFSSLKEMLLFSWSCPGRWLLLLKRNSWQRVNPNYITGGKRGLQSPLKTHLAKLNCLVTSEYYLL